ncbi:hypothetical protein ACFLU6_10935 [Acidobacteriota bacterium]
MNHRAGSKNQADIRPRLSRYVIYCLIFVPIIFILYIFLAWLLRFKLEILPRITWSRAAGSSEYRIFFVAMGITLTYFCSIWISLRKTQKIMKLKRVIGLLFTTVICSMLLWYSLLGIAGSLMNKMLDRSEPAIHKSIVLSSAEESIWKEGSHRFLTIKSWRQGASQEVIKGPASDLQHFTQGDHVHVIIRQGFFGIPWVAQLISREGQTVE